MHYLITGGAGFIGSHLAERLLQDGHTVTSIDDLSTGAIHNIEHLKGVTGFRYVVNSIFDRPLLAELIDDCDAVFHLAAAVGVKLIVESPVRTIATNVRGTEAVLELASKKKKTVLLASTSEVYGKTSKLPAFDTKTGKEAAALTLADELAAPPIFIQGSATSPAYIVALSGGLNNQWKLTLAGPPPVKLPSIDVVPLTALPGQVVPRAGELIPRE